MDYIIYGAGAIGTILGATLAQAGKRVGLIGRQAHVDAINARGITVRGVRPAEGIRVTAVTDFDPGMVEEDTILCLTMKTDDTKTALDAAGDAIGSTPVIAFQNGVENERQLERRGLRAYGGLVYCGTKFLEPGVVVHTAEGHFGIGKVPKGSDDVCARVAADITAGGKDGKVYDDVMPVKYTKLLENLSNAFRAMTDLDFHSAAKHEESRLFMAEIMDEALRVLRASDIEPIAIEGHRHPDEQVASMRRPGERSFDVPANDEDKIFSSTWQDLCLKRGKVEVAHFNGEIVRLGKKAGIATPYNTLMWSRCSMIARERMPPGTETVATLQARLDDPKHNL